MDNWEDVSEYSRGDITRTPNQFRLDTMTGGIIIHRHRDYPEGHWLTSCFDLNIDSAHLDSKDIKKAKMEALILAEEKLKIYSKTRDFVLDEIEKLENDASKQEGVTE